VLRAVNTPRANPRKNDRARARGTHCSPCANACPLPPRWRHSGATEDAEDAEIPLVNARGTENRKRRRKEVSYSLNARRARARAKTNEEEGARRGRIHPRDDSGSLSVAVDDRGGDFLALGTEVSISRRTLRHRRRFARLRARTARECEKLVAFTSSVYDRDSSRDTRSSVRVNAPDRG